MNPLFTSDYYCYYCYYCYCCYSCYYYYYVQAYRHSDRPFDCVIALPLLIFILLRLRQG
ncbi:uncharacterized protein F4817DRAFT_343237 [Daldinia loculata]|uniref:uncharacterized protein n=1 Tax=Daldinia loculata TaxID=103429 RepID=UPI0020C3CC5D|nr:uncharacterized protein F4817DRAFT_343237 [Daldinia loculata]KAI1645627.1 hypothetical protein F4817DRAFT_343237 [Daldinia loculata]